MSETRGPHQRVNPRLPRGRRQDERQPFAPARIPRALLALGLALALVLGATHCARRPPADVTVWSWNIAAEALEALVPGFERAHPGWTVEVRDLGNQQVYDRGLAGCAVGGVDLPDVYTVENCEAELFWSRFPDCWTDLAPLGADRLRGDYPAFKWTELTVGSRIYAVPWDSGPVVMFYRRDLYRQAGIDPAAIQTWEDFERAGRRMLEATGGQVRMATMSAGQDDEWFRMLANQNGSSYFDPSGRRITVASLGCVEALETMKRLKDAGVLAEGGWNEQLQLVKAGRVAGALFGAWYEGTLRSSAPEQSGLWGMYEMPAFRPGGPRAANLGGSALAIPASCRNRDAAWAFVTWCLARSEPQVAMLREQGLVPSYLPCGSDPYVGEGQPFWGGQRIWRLALGTLDRIPPSRSTEHFQEARQVVTVVCTDFLAGRYPSARVALDEAARQISRATGLPLAGGEGE